MWCVHFHSLVNTKATEHVTVKEKQKTNEGKLNLIYIIIINIKINDSTHINSVIREKGYDRDDV